jgi:hypothetical protein
MNRGLLVCRLERLEPTWKDGPCVMVGRASTRARPDPPPTTYVGQRTKVVGGRAEPGDDTGGRTAPAGGFPVTVNRPKSLIRL